MIAKPQKERLELILKALKASKAKFLTAEALSREIGLVPDAIQAACSMFNPLVSIDYTFDLKQLIPELDAYLSALPSSRPITKRTTTGKRKPLPYQSVIEFVYDKMTYSGIVDKSKSLSDAELRLLRRLALEELKLRKAGKKTK